LQISGNDPRNPQVTIPITLEVIWVQDGYHVYLPLTVKSR
jgi:hypothetical protein